MKQIEKGPNTRSCFTMFLYKTQKVLMHYIFKDTSITLAYKIENRNITRNSPRSAKKKYQQTKMEISYMYINNT